MQTAESGYDAGMLTESFRPHVIVLDYMLPDVNGNIVCQRLREREEFGETRVLFVSGVVRQEEIDNLLASGGDAFLRKPFDIDSLREQIESLCGFA